MQTRKIQQKTRTAESFETAVLALITYCQLALSLGDERVILPLHPARMDGYTFRDEWCGYILHQ